MGHASDFFSVAKTICETISYEQIDNLAEQLVALRDRKGRLFLIGVGGSAANCSHAVNDFKKLCSIRAFTPLDNVAELTARINDEGWDTVFANWLQEVGLNDDDALLILSVGGCKSYTTGVVQYRKSHRLRDNMRCPGIWYCRQGRWLHCA